MNTWIYLLIAVIALFMMIPRADKQVEVSGTRSSNFEISPESRKMFEKMKLDGISNDSLKKFLVMEDRFLEYEKDSACRGRDRIMDATGLDQGIRDTFIAYDFTYHNKHLKQIADTKRVINPYLKCFSA